MHFKVWEEYNASDKYIWQNYEKYINQTILWQALLGEHRDQLQREWVEGQKTKQGRGI